MRPEHPQGAGEGLPFYQPVGDELTVFEHCHRTRLPLLLKGPTGCGKSRFVEHMAARLGRPLVTVACHDDTSATDLLGRFLIEGGDTVWVDGPATRAVRQGAILYLDEIAEARPDVLVVIHPLTDHRRSLVVDRHDELIPAPAGFMLVASFNPGYTQGFKGLKPSTRQRFVGLSFDYPAPELEMQIVAGEAGVDAKLARRLVKLGQRLRALDELGVAEGASTRLLVDAAQLIRDGLPPRLAGRVAIVEPLTDEAEVRQALGELVDLAL
ncbi:MAG: CbbQ/NirQ/NorQ/GpvN family protein [Myxococcales bacterium]|nr:CbbQ/NirQ/NorQ/GpvN family protein [Myxococcales bacterium]MCB9524153.1 CbbQ/NirQ/NorQ/GpvN family protein [Myxococcales bacterium]